MKISIPKVTQWSLISAEDLAKGCTLPVGQTPEIMFDCCSTTSEANCAVVISTSWKSHGDHVLGCATELQSSILFTTIERVSGCFKKIVVQSFLSRSRAFILRCNVSIIHSFLILSWRKLLLGQNWPILVTLWQYNTPFSLQKHVIGGSLRLEYTSLIFDPVEPAH